MHMSLHLALQNSPVNKQDIDCENNFPAVGEDQFDFKFIPVNRVTGKKKDILPSDTGISGTKMVLPVVLAPLMADIVPASVNRCVECRLQGKIDCEIPCKRHDYSKNCQSYDKQYKVLHRV